MKLLLRLFVTLMLAALTLPAMRAQGSETYGSGLKVNLNENGSRYVRFIIWNQLWTRMTQNNPGTAGADGNVQDNSFDMGLRRARFLAYAQLSPRYLILTHIGINNQTFINGGTPGGGATGNAGSIPVTGTVPEGSTTVSGSANGASAKKPQLFFHDFWNEFLVVKGKTSNLSVGFGLHYWNAVSRLSSASTLNFLAIDAPIFNWFNIELTDQFARQFGVYAKGKLGKLDYRFHLNKPFSINQTASATATRAFHAPTDNLSLGGYVNWQFLDQESNLLPFFVGTYVGTKKVFNLGAGFYQHANATATKDNNVLSYHDQTLFSVDAFLDLPLGSKEKGTALTAYAAYYNMDFGPNYYRSVGIMNTNTSFAASYTGPRSVDGAGNGRALLGTGDIVYAQAGLLLPKHLSKKVKIQPFGALTLKNLDYLGIGTTYYDIGSNFFLDGHHAKFTIQWSSRPVMVSGTNGFEQNARRGELILQTHIFL
jgi:hypothetical protein